MPFVTRPLRALLLASSTLLPAALHAQEVNQLPPVEVESGGAAAVSSAPVSGSELSREDIRRRRNSTSDTADLLRQLPGVSVNAGGGFSSMPAIRGLTEQRVKITVDGHPIDSACPSDMNSPLSYTDPLVIQSDRKSVV